MKKQIFKGVGTALITPFKNGEIDYAALDKIIDHQIFCGVDAIIVGGTTGEAATLSDTERYSLFDRCRERIPKNIKLILGTGTNDTAATLRHTRYAEGCGADGVLIVTPYYNKGTYRGVTEHYLRVSSSTGLPIILYNVPQRTGVNLTLSQIERLIKEENIVAIKEAGDSADRLVALSKYGDELGVYAGNDTQTYSMLMLGGLGVISVISNSHPALCLDITKNFSLGRIEESRRAQIRALPYIEAMFRETNPAPIKYAMSRLLLCENELRLPLYEVGAQAREEIDRLLKEI